MIQRFTIPNYRPPPKNQLMRRTLRRSIKLRKECHEFIATYAKLSGMVKATGPRRVSLAINLKGRQREYDYDALIASVSDALVACGMLIGDREGQAFWGGVKYSREGEHGTTIILEDLYDTGTV